jgi:hypothetical protein
MAILTNSEKEYFFNKLDDFIKKEEEKENMCCNNKNIIYDYTQNNEVCTNCGVVNNLIIDEISYTKSMQMNFKLYGNKNNYNNIHRLYNWDRVEYKDKTIIENNSDIDKIIEKISKKYDIFVEIYEYNKIKEMYKNIYITNKITSRSNIKKSLFLICIYIILKEKHKKLNIFDLLDLFNLTINNYNSATQKINYLLIDINIEKYKKVMEYYYNIDFDLDYLIESYNRIFNILKDKKIRINKKAITIIVMYKKLLNNKLIKDKVRFCNIAKINLRTFNKHKKIIYNLI